MQDFTKKINTINQLTNYFENVLGIKSFLLSENVSDNSVTNVSKPLISIQDFSNYSTSEVELTKKILAAVGLLLENVTVVEIETPNCILRFVDQPQNEFQIYSPRLLLQKPEFKKIAWDKLKNIME